MKLTEILSRPEGETHVWLYSRESDALTSVKKAMQRVHVYCTHKARAGLKVSTKGVALVNGLEFMEPAVMVTILKQPKR